MLPPEMEGRTFPLLGESDSAVPSRQYTHESASDSPPQLPGPRPMEASPAGTWTPDTRLDMYPPRTIRTVTPEPRESKQTVLEADALPRRRPSAGSSARSPQSSPRSNATARSGLSTARRQGVVFDDAANGTPFDTSSSSPPARPPTFRSRTHTLDGALRQQFAPVSESRHRVSSFSSSRSHSLKRNDDVRGPTLQSQAESPAVSPAPYFQTSELQQTPPPSIISKDKKTTSRSRLVKRASSRPTSPLISPPPSVDSLPVPICTSNANKILLLMKALCGRMRGHVDFQQDRGGPWSRGLCYVDEDKESLMFDSGDMGPFHTPIIPDLRGCRVLPLDTGDQDTRCLELVSGQPGHEILLRPLAADEVDLWLAALLCWQQLRPPGAKLLSGRGTAQNSGRAEVKRSPSAQGPKSAAIIKVAKLLLWDKGIATSPRAVVKRPSTRDLRSSPAEWKRVSCILQDNGELKLMTENDVAVLSVIELSQLARCAIQQLDRSVLDQEFCIAIFPIYSATSSRLSILRPVYVALESRVLFEVWLVLLRAFTVPGIYALESLDAGEALEVMDHSTDPTASHFRLEKTLTLRVTEAKLRTATMASGVASYGRTAKLDEARLVGNYLAEVILDGEVRARTTTKFETKNPFWREDCEFADLPSTVPFLSVLLKRVDVSLDQVNNRVPASAGSPKMGGVTEVLCGTVEIPLQQLERGKDHEQWHTINDEMQQSIGTMLIKVHHEELVVLCANQYQPLSELLHNFSTGLTAQISEAVQGNSKRLAQVFVNIFQVSGNATEWLMNLVEDEIDGIGNQAAIRKQPRFSRRLRSNESIESSSDRELLVRDMGKSLTGEANLLFRGNSLLTQALEFHMRRLGKEYLEDILSEKISEINEANANYEVDPSKLGLGDDIQKNWAHLIRLITEVWECIVPSANRVPQELRLILKYIRAVAEDRYGDFLRTVTYTSVSGFLFLRFICPAILNPKLFGLLRDHPRPLAQRSLTLIAKCLQALANLSTIGKKETWTQPMNHFINTQRQALKDFIDNVCDIPIEGTTIAVPASYSTPITILGRLAPLAREGFPSLPYLIDHARNFALLVKLWTDANPAATTTTASDTAAAAGSSTRVFDGDLLDFHSLCTAIQQRANERHAQIEKLRLLRLAAAAGDEETAASGADQSRLATAEAQRLSELTDVFDRSSLLDAAVPSSYGSSTAVWTDQDLASGSGLTLRPPGSSGSDMESSGFSATAFRDAGRFGVKDAGPTRQHASGNSDWHLGGSPASTIRGLKNGKHARKLLSGFMRKDRTVSPDVVAGSRDPIREESHDVREWNRDHRDRLDKSRDRDTHSAKNKEQARDEERNVMRDRKKGLGLTLEPKAMDNGGSHRDRQQQND